MKIGITGHSQGIGRALYNLYSADNEVLGFSRSNGFDISSEDIQNQIVKTCKKFDMFINNAWHPTGQSELLQKFINLWDKDRSKVIINIGSKASFWADRTTHPYAISKSHLQKIVNERMYEPYPKIMTVIPGMVDTDMAKEIKIKNKLTPEEVAKFIKNITDQKSSVWVQQIMIAHLDEHFYIHSHLDLK